MATFLLTLLLACGEEPTTQQAVIVPDIESLRLEPATAEVRIRAGSSEEVAFTAWATTPDEPSEIELTLVAWSLSNLSLGEISDSGVYQSPDTHGGVTEVIANHLGVEASAEITVIYEQDIFEGDATEAVAAAFEAAEPADEPSLALLYPADGATVPRNIDGLAFLWDPPDGHDIFHLRMQSDQTDISIYTTSPTYSTSADLWEIVSATNTGGRVEITVESGQWSGGALTDARRGPSIEITVNRLDARGSIVYWSTTNELIARIPFGVPEARDFWTDPDGDCTGCHSLNEDRDLMVVTHGGGELSVVDIADLDNPTQLVAPQPETRATWTTFSPDGTQILATVVAQEDRGGAWLPEILLFSADDGAPLASFPTQELIAHPMWSPEGTHVLMVHAHGTFLSDLDFEGGDIVEYPWEDDALGEPVVLAASEEGWNNYYPTYSPDGEWIAYNRSPGNCYAHPEAELWLMSRDGSVKLRLDRANGPDVLMNSFPRWAPLPDDDVLWLAFSSNRLYPLSDKEETQIWVTAVDTTLAAKGQDPSQPAFWLPGQDLYSNNHIPAWWKD